ncbi:MAG: transcriptional regulator [Microbacterium sp.]|jgi:DNA-binding LacI/PurR family transcriptional regulator|uniref:LacI family DNA-binding transcriptional regulator n=1 Tax=Microbacterium TaxID=33882 RepID=UPI0007340D2C|nr:LacI family DNA-binding transcriptional regulator [Microbacterium testaceum]KTS55920.1 LacI family transcriptional regulator [Microbacterium testaceum]KTS85590.1 LacI family transcriptional regulator [Microbacterium testaceum]MDF2917508.1 transcriptional regulator [Microbacterium sp.]
MSLTPVRGAATIEEVAARAGVSRSTVSRVVNGSTAVSPAALDAVQRAIDELQYVPNRAARSLASRQTRAIALVIPEDTDRFFGDPFFGSIVAGISQVIGESDYVMNMLIASDDASAKALGYLRSGSVDGAIVASHHTSDTFIDRLADTVPVVYGGRPARVRPTDHYVDVDNVQGGRDATQYLLDRGHRRIATVAGPADMPAGIDRLQGFRDALAAAGLEPFAVEDGGFTETEGADAMRRILASGDVPDAVFVASDLMARGAYTALRERGLEPGRDVAVIGFDDSSVATSLLPALTTIRQPSHDQGRQMARMLLDLLAGRAPASTAILPTEIIERGSA